MAFSAGLVAGCSTPKGMSDVDKELAKARKQAGQRESAECYPSSKEPCYTQADGQQGPEGTAGRGICQEGLRVCDAEGFWSTCDGAVLPERELCNKIDDDCNGKVDDGFEREGAKCFAGEGECRAEGTYSCSADGTQSVCSATAKAPTAEVCDGRDNDCDGEIDDGDVEGTGASCKTGQAGACAEGIKQCVTGSIKCMPTHIRTVEICNKVDDDCDNKVDEDCISEEEARKAGLLK
ncbi:MopE-related protein [Pseudenhygromyxa sp. WMMC2535]|uniref:MopE-related protein n=1 Tax=Pseudenhygromyxa sp. WMMC2535 TaxID=2712867 RepID=UPI0020D19FED|nr:MopE-related protein [Pseudenhygromyxa sp. WMMC2535]